MRKVGLGGSGLSPRYLRHPLQELHSHAHLVSIHSATHPTGPVTTRKSIATLLDGPYLVLRYSVTDFP